MFFFFSSFSIFKFLQIFLFVCLLILNSPKYLYESFHQKKKIYVYKLSFIVTFNIVFYFTWFLLH